MSFLFRTKEKSESDSVSEVSEIDSEMDSDVEYTDLDEKDFNDYYEGQRINKTQSRGLYNIVGFLFLSLWSHNRKIDKKRVHKIYKSLKEDYEKNYENSEKLICLTTSSEINICKLNNEYFVVDGQHRLEAYKKLYSEIEREFFITVLITDCQSNYEIIERFQLINKHTVVDSEELGQLDIEIFCDMLDKHFQPLLPSNSIYGKNRPYINKDNFVKAIRDNNLHRLNNSNELFNKFVKCNERLLSIKKLKGVSSKYFQKGKELGFMLGQQKDYAYIKDMN